MGREVGQGSPHLRGVGGLRCSSRPRRAPPKDASGHCLCTSGSTLAERWGRAFTPNQLKLQLNSYLSILLRLHEGLKALKRVEMMPKVTYFLC